MTLRLWISISALILVVGVVLAPAIAQRLNGDSAPGYVDPEMTHMVSLMDGMMDHMSGMMAQQPDGAESEVMSTGRTDEPHLTRR